MSFLFGLTCVFWIAPSKTKRGSVKRQENATSVVPLALGISLGGKEHNVRDRFGNLKLSMFTSPESPWAAFPKLKGRASEVRSLGPALTRFWESQMDRGSAVHKQVHLALRASCALEDVLTLHKDDIRLPPTAAAEIKRAIHAFLTRLTALGAHFHNTGTKLFNITIKAHYLAHVAEISEWWNPRLGWCYAGEDYMNKVKKLAANCLRGTPAPLVSRKFLHKYALGMHIRLSERPTRR